MGFTNFETSDRVLNTRMNTFGNELLSEISKYSTYDLYLKQGNLMNPQKPTGAGTEVTFANVTNVEKLAYTFNYAIPKNLIICKDNRYNLVIPFKQLDVNRSFVFRFLYKHEGTVIFDITRNAVTTATGDLTVKFQALNQNIVDITALANTTVTLQIFVKTLTGTDAQISLLVNDVNALGRLSRNEATAIVSADNVLMPDGTTSVSSAIGQLAKFNRTLTSSDNLFLLTGDKYTIYKVEAETPLNSPIINLTYSMVEFIPFGASGQRKLVISNYGQPGVIGKKWEIMLQPNGTPYQVWKEIVKTDNFTPTSKPLVVGSGFEAQTGAVPFNVTKSGQMLYFIGQLKCLANTTSSPVVLATSPIPTVGYFYLNILVNGVRQEGLSIAPGTGQIYIYKSFSANDIITFNGFAIGDI